MSHIHFIFTRRIDIQTILLHCPYCATCTCTCTIVLYMYITLICYAQTIEIPFSNGYVHTCTCTAKHPSFNGRVFFTMPCEWNLAVLAERQDLMLLWQPIYGLTCEVHSIHWQVGKVLLRWGISALKEKLVYSLVVWWPLTIHVHVNTDILW